MTRPREGNFKAVMLYLDPDELDEFSRNLPKFKSASEVLREYIHDENLRKKQEKKVMAPDKSPLNNRPSIIYIDRDRDSKQATLDIFAKSTAVHNFVEKTNDLTVLRKITSQAHLIESLCRTKCIKMTKLGAGK